MELPLIAKLWHWLRQQDWRVVALVIAVGVVVALLQEVRHARQERVLAELAAVEQKQLFEHTVAKLAISEATMDSVMARAAKLLHGKPIGTVVIQVPGHVTDTTHPALPTTTTDFTRTATVNDTLGRDVLTGVITAPPCCAPLAFRYQFIRSPFSPRIGFIQVGDSVVAVVNWDGDSVRVAEAWHAPVFRQPRLTKMVGLDWQPAPEAWRLEGGVEYRLLGQFRLEGVLSQQLAVGQRVDRPQLWLGGRYRW